jgi:hypothetical protein
MQPELRLNRASRDTLSLFLDRHSPAQLNAIPFGFGNNLIWNIGHVVVTQQLLVYRASGLDMMIDDELVSRYKKGTRPEGIVTEEGIGELRRLLYPTIEKTSDDLASGIFREYREFTSSFGFTVSNVHDALVMNNYHEATHIGMMMSIRKFV